MISSARLRTGGDAIGHQRPAAKINLPSVVHETVRLAAWGRNGYGGLRILR
jgi:hypothetical protein